MFPCCGENKPIPPGGGPQTQDSCINSCGQPSELKCVADLAPSPTEVALLLSPRLAARVDRGHGRSSGGTGGRMSKILLRGKILDVGMKRGGLSQGVGWAEPRMVRSELSV